MKKIIVMFCFLSLSSSINAMLGGDPSFVAVQEVNQARREEREEKEQSAKKNTTILRTVGGLIVVGIGFKHAYNGIHLHRTGLADLDRSPWPTKGSDAHRDLIDWIRKGNRSIVFSGVMVMGLGIKLLSDAIKKSRES